MCGLKSRRFALRGFSGKKGWRKNKDEVASGLRKISVKGAKRMKKDAKEDADSLPESVLAPVAEWLRKQFKKVFCCFGGNKIGPEPDMYVQSESCLSGNQLGPSGRSAGVIRVKEAWRPNKEALCCFKKGKNKTECDKNVDNGVLLKKNKPESLFGKQKDQEKDKWIPTGDLTPERQTPHPFQSIIDRKNDGDQLELMWADARRNELERETKFPHLFSDFVDNMASPSNLYNRNQDEKVELYNMKKATTLPTISRIYPVHGWWSVLCRPSVKFWCDLETLTVDNADVIQWEIPGFMGPVEYLLYEEELRKEKVAKEERLAAEREKIEAERMLKMKEEEDKQIAIQEAMAVSHTLSKIIDVVCESVEVTNTIVTAETIFQEVPAVGGEFGINDEKLAEIGSDLRKIINMADEESDLDAAVEELLNSSFYD